MGDAHEDHDATERATDDDAVQAFLDVKWRDATRAAREGMNHLRTLWPELVAHLPETASGHLRRALNEFESAYASLHKAGPHVLGQADYDSYLETQTERQIRG